MNAPLTHFLPLTVIRRERVLPRPGKVIVRAGQKLNALDVIAETVLEPEYQLLDIARILGFSREKADRYIQCQVGDQLSKGDVIAGPVGISNRIVRAQKDSKVVVAGDGQVLVEAVGKPYQLKASIPGDVIDLIPDRGAIIETSGALLQGVWGNDRLDFGMMVVLAKFPDHVLTVADLDVSLRGAIVLSGQCHDPEALKMANDLPLRGLILGSMDVELIPFAARLPFPVILLEGFGNLPINPVAFRLLASNDRREVAVNAFVREFHTHSRPEIVIPLPAPSSTAPPQAIDAFAPDKQVRILRAPSAGQMGVIVALKGNYKFPGGLRAPMAEVRLSDGKIAAYPLANLEIIG